MILRVANDNDYLQATIAADQLFPNVTIANSYKYNGEVEAQLLYRCVTDLENKPIGTITNFRDLLTPEIKSSLIDELDAFHEECSPIMDKMSNEEFDKLLDSIKKNVQDIGNISSIHTLRRLIVSLVSVPKK